jgi:hypothetical protein
MAKKRAAVRSEMGGAFPAVSMTGGKGLYGRNKPPFGAPQSMGGGGIPTKFFDESVPHKAASSLTPTQTAGKLDRMPRPGTVQRKFGVSDK